MCTPISPARPGRARRLLLSLSLVAGLVVAVPLVEPAVAAAVTLARVLASGESMGPGSVRYGPFRQYQLTLLASGDLVITGQGQQLWHSGTGNRPNSRLTMLASGDLVLTDPSGIMFWHTNTWNRPGAVASLGADGLLSVGSGTKAFRYLGVRNSVLSPGRTLQPSWRLVSPSGRTSAVMQAGGNLVVYRDGVGNWSSRTNGHPGATVTMQNDGNMVLHARDGSALWHSHTWQQPLSSAQVQDDGYLVVYTANGTPVWWRDMGGGATVCNSVKPDPNGTNITRWNPVTLCVLTSLRQSRSNLSDVNIMIEWESGGDPNAINLWDSNAKAGHPSIGLIQVIKSTFEAWRSLQLPDNQYNPAANLFAGLNYAIHRYGSIHNVPGLVSLRKGGGYVGYSLPR